MDLALTCMLCLAATTPAAGPPPLGGSDGALNLSLASASAPPLDLRLSDLGDPGASPPLAQHEHGSQDGEGDSQGHDGHGAWMGTAMIVMMVAMMATVGVVMMTRGGARSAPPLSSPAAAAIPVAR